MKTSVEHRWTSFATAGSSTMNAMKRSALCVLFIGLQFSLFAQSEAIDSLKKEAQVSTDPETKSLASDLATKASALTKSLKDNPDAQRHVESALNAVAGNKGPAAVSGLQTLTALKLTPEQTNLSKEVYHVGSAYIVKRNFATLEGSQSEVSQVVNSLREGSPAKALPALKKIGENAKLTQPQKDLVASLTKNLTPGLADGLKGLPGLK